jgi:hypothetical protein
MLSPHLVRHIEQHAEKLASEIVDELLRHPRTTSLRQVDREELLHHTRAVYERLGDWVAGRTEAEVEATFGARGRDRFLEGVPIEEMVFALVLMKRQLRHHTKQVSSLVSAAEIHAEMEVDAMVGTFFDRVLYAMVCGYEAGRHEAQHPKHRPTSTALGDMKPKNVGWIP